MKLTKEQVQKLMAGQTLTVVCDNQAELASVYEIAKRTRREDGLTADQLSISCSYKTMAVVLRRNQVEPINTESL